MTNDYKKDEGKVPLLAALQPFVPALYALAAMMDDMQHKHKLAGSADPFKQWAQLPEAKRRMSSALVRHLLPEDGDLWTVNTKDGRHLHAVHGLFNLLGAITMHLRQAEANVDRCCGAPDAKPLEGPAGADWRERSGVKVAGQYGHYTCTCTCGAGQFTGCTCANAFDPRFPAGHE